MAGDKKPKVDTVKKYAPPFSVRLTLAERARLDAEAGPLPLGEYVRVRLFDVPDTRQRVYRRPVQDAEALGQVLSALGDTRMAGNLYQIVRAIHNGCLLVTPEQQKGVEEALIHVREMRQWLIAALGLQADSKNGLKDEGIQPPKPDNIPPPVGTDDVSGSSGGENP